MLLQYKCTNVVGCVAITPKQLKMFSLLGVMLDVAMRVLIQGVGGV